MSEQQIYHSPEIRNTLGKFWTVSNILSLSRLVLSCVIVYLILTQPTPNPLTISLVFIAIASDWFDGRIARWSKTVSDWGKVLDPMADKLGGGFVLIAMGVKGLLPLWLVTLFVVREVIFFSAWQYMIRRTNHVYMSLWPGKFTVGILALTAFFILLGVDAGPRKVLIWASGIAMVYSLFHYMVLFILELKSLSTGEKGEVQAEQQALRNKKQTPTAKDEG
jgi:cardiolipin synthase